MSKTASKPKTPKSARNPLALDLPPELRARLKTIAESNDMTLSLVTRMCINSGIDLVNQKLSELREPAALAS